MRREKEMKQMAMKMVGMLKAWERQERSSAELKPHIATQTNATTIASARCAHRRARAERIAARPLSAPQFALQTRRTIAYHLGHSPRVALFRVVKNSRQVVFSSIDAPHRVDQEFKNLDNVEKVQRKNYASAAKSGGAMRDAMRVAMWEASVEQKSEGERRTLSMGRNNARSRQSLPGSDTVVKKIVTIEETIKRRILSGQMILTCPGRAKHSVRTT